MTLNGKKILLRPIETSDVEQTLRFHQDLQGMVDLMGFVMPVNLENEKHWIDNLYPQNNRSNIYFGICGKDNKDHLVGYISAKNINQINRTAEFGIYIEKDSRRKGIAKEAITIFITYLYSQIHIRKIFLFVLNDNEKAINLYKSTGFIQEGVMRDHCWKDGGYRDLIIMSKFTKNIQKENKK